MFKLGWQGLGTEASGGIDGKVKFMTNKEVQAGKFHHQTNGLKHVYFKGIMGKANELGAWKDAWTYDVAAITKFSCKRNRFGNSTFPGSDVLDFALEQ